MRFDKEALIKHQFWFLLLVFVFLVASSLLLLRLSMASAVEAKQKDIDKAKTTIQGALPAPPNLPENDKWLDPLEKRNKKADDKKKEIWASAWNNQEAFMTWPANLPQDLSRFYFGDPISDETSDVFTNQLYLPEVWEVANMVEPQKVWQMVNEVDPVRALKSDLVVQYKDGPEKVLNYIRSKPWKADHPPPPAEEIWLAQEDLWVQKGLLLAVREANNSVAAFQKAGGANAGTLAKGQSFINPDWKLDLSVRSEAGKITLSTQLTNVSARRQKLGIRFRVYYSDNPDRPQEIFADGEPLAPNQSLPKPIEVPITSLHPAADRVEQIFDWRTVPVKRVDRIQLCAQSHRTFLRDLIQAPVFAPKDTDATTSTTPGLPVTAPAGPMTSGSGAGGFGSPGGAGTAKPDALTPNGLERYRYSDVTQAVRRMPFALIVIVDQDHMQDLVTAIANSKLRIQTTQVEWQRYRGSIKPPSEGEAGAPTPGTMTPGGSTSRGTMSPGGSTGMMPSRTGPGTSPGSSATPAAEEDQGAGLVQMAIYGIATLYQKYPPKPKEDTQTSAPGLPTVPPSIK